MAYQQSVVESMNDSSHSSSTSSFISSVFCGAALEKFIVLLLRSTASRLRTCTYSIVVVVQETGFAEYRLELLFDWSLNRRSIVVTDLLTMVSREARVGLAPSETGAIRPLSW